MPVAEYYYSRQEWDRLGCGPLPPERDRTHLIRLKEQQDRQAIFLRGNTNDDDNAVRSYD